MSELELTTEFEIVECGKCGQTYALTKKFIARRMSDHETFWCPRGDARHYPLQSNEDKLREQVKHCKEDAVFWEENYDDQAERLQTVQRSRSAYKGQLTRMKSAAHPKNGAA